MKEELKAKIADIIREHRNTFMNSQEIVEEFSDLIDREYAPEPLSDSDMIASCDKIEADYKRFDDLMKEHFTACDRIIDYLRVKPKSEESIIVDERR